VKHRMEQHLTMQLETRFESCSHATVVVVILGGVPGLGFFKVNFVCLVFFITFLMTVNLLIFN